MKTEIPKVFFKKNESLNIEVMEFSRLIRKLNQSTSHDSFAPHKIEFFLILIVTKNSYSHFVDFKSYELKKGSALFIAKNQVHHFKKGLEKVEGICILFSGPFMEKYYYLSGSSKLNRLFNYHIETPVVHQVEMGRDNLADIANELLSEYYSNNDFAKSEILRTLLHVLLLKAERAKESHAITSVKPHWLEVFGTFKNMLEKEYVNTRNSRTYASEMFVSYKFLNEVVKKLTGKTVKVFIDNFVTMEIRRYLLSTSLSVKEICYKTGFDEPSNLIKFFKKNTSTTPQQFRAQF